MPITLQVRYPITADTHFDDAHCATTHMRVQTAFVTKGPSGGPDTPPAFHAIATFVFADPKGLDTAMGKAGPVLADIPNFTNATPRMLIGQTYA